MRDLRAKRSWLDQPSSTIAPSCNNPRKTMNITDEIIDAVAERIYEDAHAGMSNVWSWHDGGLDHEHPDVRDRFIGYARSALAPAPANASEPVEIKQLEWSEDGNHLRARLGDREYMLNITSDGVTWAGATRPYSFGSNLTWSSVPNCSNTSLNEAKAAAQADFEARIRSALVTT